MLLEPIYLWFLINRLSGMTILTLPGRVVRPVLLAGLMYGTLMLLKTMLPLSSIPFFDFMSLSVT